MLMICCIKIFYLVRLRGVGLNNVALNTEVTLDTVFGLPLASGSNGTFGDSPITVGAAYTAQMVKVFNGEDR